MQPHFEFNNVCSWLRIGCVSVFWLWLWLFRWLFMVANFVHKWSDRKWISCQCQTSNYRCASRTYFGSIYQIVSLLQSAAWSVEFIFSFWYLSAICDRQQAGLFFVIIWHVFQWIIFLQSEWWFNCKLQALRSSSYRKTHLVAMKIRKICKIIISSARNE